jgi:hypothetical protein
MSGHSVSKSGFIVQLFLRFSSSLRLDDGIIFAALRS